VRSLAHRIAAFPAAGAAALKDRINAIALAPAEDFRRDSDLFGVRAGDPETQRRFGAAMERGFQTGTGRWRWPGWWPTCRRLGELRRSRRGIPGFDGLDGVHKGLFQDALADGPENEAERPSLDVLAVAHHDGVQVGRAVGPPREGVGVARAASP
jgi:hypothetical protein